MSSYNSEEEENDGERSFKPVTYEKQEDSEKEYNLKRDREEDQSFRQSHYQKRPRRRENWHNGKYIAGPGKFDKDTSTHVMCCPKCKSNTLIMDVFEVNVGHFKHMVLESKHSTEYDQQILPPFMGIRVICDRCPRDSRGRAAAYYLNIAQNSKRIEYTWDC